MKYKNRPGVPHEAFHRRDRSELHSEEKEKRPRAEWRRTVAVCWGLGLILIGTAMFLAVGNEADQRFLACIDLGGTPAWCEGETSWIVFDLLNATSAAVFIAGFVQLVRICASNCSDQDD